MITNALWAGTAFTVQIQGIATFADPAAHLLVEDAAFVLLVSAAAAAIPMVIVTCLEALRQGGFPRWFAALGAIAVLGLATAYWYVPLAAFLVWIAVGSVLLTKGQPVTGPRPVDVPARS